MSGDAPFFYRFLGRRWYGQLVDPTFLEESFDEKESTHSRGIPRQTWDKRTIPLIISEPTVRLAPSMVSHHVSLVFFLQIHYRAMYLTYLLFSDLFEMRQRSKVLEEGIFDYEYSQYCVMIRLVTVEGAGFFHCNRP